MPEGVCARELEIGNNLLRASSTTHTHIPSIAPPPRQVEERKHRRKKVRFKGVLTDRNKNTSQAPPETTCSTWRSWKDIKADREQLPTGWKQEMKDKRKEKKREKKTQRLLAAKSMAQQALSLLEYQMYDLETKAVQEEAKQATQAEGLGHWTHDDKPAPMPLPPAWTKQDSTSDAGRGAGALESR